MMRDPNHAPFYRTPFQADKQLQHLDTRSSFYGVLFPRLVHIRSGRSFTPELLCRCHSQSALSTFFPEIWQCLTAAFNLEDFKELC